MLSQTKHSVAYCNLYRKRSHMLERCYDPNHPRFHDYGGRGITVCDKWRNDFGSFLGWALLHGYKKELEIDRRDNNGNYTPENCRFVTRRTNLQNKRRTVHPELPVGVFTVGKRYRAQIKFAGKTYRLGTWDSPSLAGVAYRAVAMMVERLEALN